MTIKGIITDYLIRQRYHGLFHRDTECGCGLDDLFCASECPNPDCEPAYLHWCSDCEIYDDCESECCSKRGGQSHCFSPDPVKLKEL